jgi:hypothetical protein
MPQIKPGTRLRSALCTSEVMVVAAPKDAEVELHCGGAPMLELGAEPTGGALSPDFAAGTQLGKRYVNEAGTLEVLCTKPGDGSLSSDGAALTIKGAKPLPASD